MLNAILVFPFEIYKDVEDTVELQCLKDVI